MAGDLNRQHARPEQPAAARESGLLMDVAASTPDGFAQDQTAPRSLAVSSKTLILFVLIAGMFATQIGDLLGSVPPPTTDSSLPAVHSSSDPDLMQFSVLPPPRILMQKVTPSQARGAVRGLEVPLKCLRPPKGDARRIKKSRPTSFVSG
ncbi:hypothetical protein E2C01_063360 [Portunus trituberculatus]|uniref:Uncharacterized protein n=1 Tax=Portunus trituberculatus TaxID=210409 RepID=A0A5B7HHY2_PORTR|nr:hypothetical protein [Portunus trituberculatus]